MSADQSPYRVYCRYCAIKAHLYTKSYNILAYNKKLSVSVDAFDRRKDRTVFYAIANAVSWQDLDHWLVANLAYRNCPSAGTLVEDLKLSRKIYDRWRKNITCIKENYVDDLTAVAKEAGWDWHRVARMSENEYPLPFRMLCAQKIALESWCLLDDLLGLSDRYNEKWTDGLHLALTSKGHKYRMLLNVSTQETAEMTPRNLESLAERT